LFNIIVIDLLDYSHLAARRGEARRGEARMNGFESGDKR